MSPESFTSAWPDKQFWTSQSSIVGSEAACNSLYVGYFTSILLDLPSFWTVVGNIHYVTQLRQLQLPRWPHGRGWRGGNYDCDIDMLAVGTRLDLYARLQAKTVSFLAAWRIILLRVEYHVHVMALQFIWIQTASLVECRKPSRGVFFQRQVTSAT